jgi:hypothetical protein
MGAGSHLTVLVHGGYGLVCAEVASEVTDVADVAVGEVSDDEKLLLHVGKVEDAIARDYLQERASRSFLGVDAAAFGDPVAQHRVARVTLVETSAAAVGHSHERFVKE